MSGFVVPKFSGALTLNMPDDATLIGLHLLSLVGIPPCAILVSEEQPKNNEMAMKLEVIKFFMLCILNIFFIFLLGINC